jgi:EpsI family protein
MRAMTFVPPALLFVGVLLISGMREQQVMPPRAAMNSLPIVMDGIPGRDLEVPEEERRVAGMSDYVMRTFGPDSAPAFTVYVGYYDRQVQGKAIHSPKNCLPGAGWEIMRSEQYALPGAKAGEKVNKVLLANNGVQAIVYYWYQGRGRIASNEYAVKLDLLRDAARFGRTEEALVRIVVPVPGRASRVSAAEVARADALAERVARELAPAVDRVLPAAPGV